MSPYCAHNIWGIFINELSLGQTHHLPLNSSNLQSQTNWSRRKRFIWITIQ